MHFSISILTDLFNQFSGTEALRTSELNKLLRDKVVDYCAVASRDGADVTRKFLVHNVESSWVAQSNGSPVVAVEVVDAETSEFRAMTMRANRITHINGEETPQKTVAHFSFTGREPTAW